MERQEIQQAYLHQEKVQVKHEAKTSANIRQGVECPRCGAINDATATFCENCGQALGQKLCPFCHAPLVPNADICEQCHRYVLDDVCSFCGSAIGSGDLFCPECGMSREGIICPVCHTSNKFSVCVNCGTPLTDSAREEMAELQMQPAYQQMRRLSKELEKLQRQIVPTTEEQKARQKQCEDIRNRVLALLNDGGFVPPVSETEVRAKTEEELNTFIRKKSAELQKLLNGMALKPQPTAAVARRYVLARKPPLTRLGWRCNFKNELHHGPQECACPQMGGTWIVTDGKQEKELNVKR